MLQTVDLGRTSLAAYRGLAPDGIFDELERVGRELRGLRVLHVNATPYGGGVSELLRSTVPLLNDMGLVAEWRIIGGDDRLFHATKRGVGPRPLSRRHLSAETLAGAIEAAVTDVGIVARAKALGERIRAEDGVGRAVEAVETALNGRALSMEVRHA